MSKRGIKRFAKAMEHLQQARYELIKMGQRLDQKGNQDIRLGQLLDKAKDAVKEDFCRISSELL